MMPPVLNLVAIVSFFACVVAACVMLAIAIRGRAVACPPCCAGCSHAVGDLVVAAGSRCPECGRALDGVDDIRYFRRALRARPFVYAGLLLGLGFGVAFGVAFLRSRFSSPGQIASQSPEELMASVGQNGDDAWLEINALAGLAPTMSDADLTATVKALHAAKNAGRLRYLSGEAANILVEAQRRTLVDNETLIELAGTGLSIDLRLDVPDDVRAGEKYQVQVAAQNVGIGSGLTTALTAVTVDGAPLALTPVHTNFATVQFDLAPGDHRIETTFNASASLRGTFATPMVSGTLTRSQPVRVHAADAPTWITSVVDDSLADEVREAIRASVVTLDRQSDGRTAIRVDLAIRPAPSIPLSFVCKVEIAGVPYWLGTRWAMMTGTGSSYTSGTLMATEQVPDSDATTATLILTPSPEAIEQQRGVERIWGREIRIPLRVIREGEPTPPAPPPPPLPETTDAGTGGGNR
ncbi:MAG: hypothetical protein JNM94_08800 [Phycisphaerae bacterium]|nr:hypothetical protein [Phycisphaerae bacterium]